MQFCKRIDKYHIYLDKLLGSGSFGQVYLGKNTLTGELVAVKIIPRRLFDDSYHFRNLQSEINIMKNAHHQNIVKFYDVYQTTNNMYIITEYCQNGDLAHYLKKHKKSLSESEAKRMIKQIMKGAKYLQTNGIIHRDLKPENILLKQEICKISDFGFAKNTSKNAILKSIVGTPLYMSPQLLKGTHYTSKSDIWSIGLIYYEMLHGCTPWPASNEVQLLSAICSRRPICSRDITQLSRNFIEKCLEINEQDRINWEDIFEHKLLKEFSRDPKDFKSFKQARAYEKEDVSKDSSQKKSATYIKDIPKTLKDDLSSKALSKLVPFTPTKKRSQQPTTPSRSRSVAKFAGSRTRGQSSESKDRNSPVTLFFRN